MKDHICYTHKAFLQDGSFGEQEGYFCTGSTSHTHCTYKDSLQCGFFDAGKGFPTFITLIGSFSSVGSLVFKKFIFVDKDLPTVTALIRPFSCVNFPMVNKTAALSKELPAVTAQIRFFSSVNSPLLREFVLLPEGFATFAAPVMALPRAGGPLSSACFCMDALHRGKNGAGESPGCRGKSSQSLCA